jgi:hypothetical protein
MLENFKKHFYTSLQDFVKISKASENVNLDVKELKELANDLNFLNYNPCSSLAIISSFFKQENIKDLKKELLNYCYYTVRDFELLGVFSFRNNELNKGINSLTNSLRFNLLIESEKRFNSDNYEIQCDKTNKFKSEKSLLKFIKSNLDETYSIIQLDIIENLVYSTHLEKPDYKWKPLNHQLEYFNKWINNTITYRDLSFNTIDLTDFITNEKIDFEIQEQIEKKREELFEEGIKRKLKSLINDLSEVDNEKRKFTIEMHKKLIYQFLNGDISKLILDRLNVFIKISDPEKVILNYDKLLHSNYYNHYELNVYEPRTIRQYSSVFSAYLIYEYLKVLNNPKLIPDQIEDDFEDVILETSRLSFKFSGEIEKLTLTLNSLQFKIDLLKDSTHINYLIDVFTSDDLSEFKEEITIACDTKQFAYVLTSLKPYFNNLTMKSIEACSLFKSKNNRLIKANNLYSKDQMKPKKSEDIDNAINQMK